MYRGMSSAEDPDDAIGRAFLSGDFDFGRGGLGDLGNAGIIGDFGDLTDSLENLATSAIGNHPPPQMHLEELHPPPPGVLQPRDSLEIRAPSPAPSGSLPDDLQAKLMDSITRAANSGLLESAMASLLAPGSLPDDLQAKLVGSITRAANSGLLEGAFKDLQEEGEEATARLRRPLDLAAPSQTITAKRVIDMNERIWEQVSALASDVQQLQQEARLSAKTQTDVTKEEIRDLYQRVADLQAGQDILRAGAAEQQAFAQRLDALQGETAGEVKECLAERDNYLLESFKKLELAEQSVAELAEKLDQFRTEVAEAFEKQGFPDIEGAEETRKHLEKMRTDHERIFVENDSTLSNLRSDLQDHMNEFDILRSGFREDHRAMKEFETRLLKLEDAEQGDLEERLNKCEEQLPKCLGLLDILGSQLQHIGEKIPLCEEKISFCEAEIPQIGKAFQHIEQSEVRLQDVMEKQQELSNTLADWSQTAKQEHNNKVADLDAHFKKDLIAQQEKVSAVCKEVAGMHEVMGSLNLRQDDCEDRVREHRNELDDLREKGSRQGAQLLDLSAMVQEAIPAVVRRTESLEGSLSHLESSIENISSRCTQDIQKISNEFSSSLREERSRARGELAASVERWHAEAEPRFTSIDRWRSNMERREVALDQRCASYEHRYSLQDQRLTSHDEAVRRLADKHQEIQMLVETRINEVRAAAKDDLAATTLTALQGEMKLMARLAQLSNQRPQAVQSGVFDGQAWQAQVASQVPGVGHMLLPVIPVNSS